MPATAQTHHRWLLSFGFGRFSSGNGGADRFAPRAFFAARVDPAQPVTSRLPGLGAGVGCQIRRGRVRGQVCHLADVGRRGAAHLVPNLAAGHARRFGLGLGRGGIAEINDVLQTLAGVHNGHGRGRRHAGAGAGGGADGDLHLRPLGVGDERAGLQLPHERARDGFGGGARMVFGDGGGAGGGLRGFVGGKGGGPAGGGGGQRRNVIGREAERGGVGGDVGGKQAEPVVKVGVSGGDVVGHGAG